MKPEFPSPASEDARAQGCTCPSEYEVKRDCVLHGYDDSDVL